MRIEGEMFPAIRIKKGASHVLEVPVNFTAHVEEEGPWDVALVISAEGQVEPQCVDLRIRKRPGGPPITTSRLHESMPLRRWVEEAILTAATVYEVLPDGTLERDWDNPPDGANRSDARRLLAPKKERRPRRNTVTKEHLAETVNAYRHHKELGTKDPLQAAGDELGLSRAAVHNRIKRARNEGFDA